MNLRPLLELCRVSNLPTVWSNAVMGIGIGLLIIDPETIYEADTRTIVIIIIFAAPACLAMSLFYSAGMIINDWIDRDIDAVERPSRPIPSGRVKAADAKILGTVMLGSGFLLVVLTQALLGPMRLEPPLEAPIMAGVLILAIFGYNLLHQRTWLAVWVMGACRGLVVLTCMSIVTTADELENASHLWLWIAGPCATLLLYTVLISIVARNEMQPRWFGGPKTVMNMIAAMPLLDAIWLAVIGLWPVSLFCIGCSVLTKLSHRKIAGS